MSEAPLKITGHDFEWHPKYIDSVAMLFAVTLILITVIAPKLFDIGPLTFSCGILLYPLLCIFGDVLTEVYGFNRTRRIIWVGLICQVLMIAVTSLAIYIPPSAAFQNQEAYALILGSVPRIAIASFVGYILGEFINSYVMSKMKVKSEGKHFGYRAMASTAASQVVDSVVFWSIAFYGVLPTSVVLTAMVSSWFFRCIYEAIALPVTTPFVGFLKKLEGVEHFDRQKLEIAKF